MSDEELQQPRRLERRRYKQKKLERQVRKSRRRLNRLRVLWKFFILVTLVTMCCMLLKLPQWRLHTNAFDSLDSPVLQVVNNKIVPSQKVLSALRRNQVSTRPIFLVKTDNLKESIKQLEPVQDVYIRRFWFPARLKIIIIERTPAITIAPDIEVPPIAFFSSDGKLIGRDYMPLSPEFKTVRIITYGVGDDYRSWDRTKVNNFKKLAMLVEDASGEQIEYIDYRDPKDVYVKIPTVNIRVGSFNAGVYDKIQRLRTLVPQVKMLNKKIKYLDLRWDSNFIKLDE